MSSVNKVILLGNLGQDPDVRLTQGGAQVCTINLATSETWVKDGKREEKTEWHKVVLWGRQAELAGKYLKKGRKVFIEGRLQTRSWDDPNGQKRYTTEIVATQLTFVDSNRGDSPSTQDHSSYEQQSSPYQQSFQPNNANFESSRTQNASEFMPIDDDVPF